MVDERIKQCMKEKEKTRKLVQLIKVFLILRNVTRNELTLLCTSEREYYEDLLQVKVIYQRWRITSDKKIIANKLNKQYESIILY